MKKIIQKIIVPAALVLVNVVFYFFFKKVSFSFSALVAESIVSVLVVSLLASSCSMTGSSHLPEGESPVADPVSAPVSANAPDSKGYDIYMRAVKCMEEKRSYLDDRLDLDHFSREIYSNKVYVSRNINHYSGMNFCQFVNYYRVKYAVGLMEKDPYLKMEEVAQMSGFHSTVSFNMAFRLFMEKTPTEWLREYLDSGLPSRTSGQEQ